LFALHRAVEGDPRAEERVIVVDRAALLEFVQYRARAFDGGAAAHLLDGLAPAARAALVRDFVREEALHREALALGLERNDYVIRQRLVQKLDFALRGASEPAPPSDAELAAWYDAHRAEYAEAGSITFAHVFFDAESRGAEAALAAARAALPALNRAHVRFDRAPEHGDRFPFHVNYVERTEDFVASHFGAEMAARLFALAPSEEWRGPFASSYGAHLVLVATRAPERAPALAEIRGRVLDDLQRDAAERLLEDALAEVIARYDVRYAPDARATLPSEPTQ
jgi:peptidyl-prolyl cis-trans isomerase C